MKQFDVFLAERLTECDLLVYSIPYRDGLSIQSQMVLRSCVEYYSLLKMIAARHGSVLVARIDQTLANVMERFSACSCIQAGARFTAQDFWYPRTSDTVLPVGARLQDLLYRQYLDGDFAVPLSAKVDKLDERRSVGRGASALSIGAELTVGNYAIGLGRLTTGVLPVLKAEECVTVGVRPAKAALGLDQETIAILRRYRYLSDMDGFPLDEFDEYLLTELDYLDIEGDVTIHLGHVSAGAPVRAEVVEHVTSFAPHIVSNAALSQHVTETLVRYRLLDDMDGLMMSSFDGEVLPNLDLVLV